MSKVHYYLHVVPNKDHKDRYDLIHSSLDTPDAGGGQKINISPRTKDDIDKLAHAMSCLNSKIVWHNKPARTHEEWLAECNSH